MFEFQAHEPLKTTLPSRNFAMFAARKILITGKKHRPDWQIGAISKVT
jgi:hypothetical protein